MRNGMQVLAALGLGLMLGSGMARDAAAQTLYNGAAGSTPGAQGWFVLGNVNTSSPATLATETYNAGTQTTTLDTSASNAIYAGYSNYNATIAPTPSVLTPTTPVNAAFPTLDRAAGYTVSFTVQINSGVTANPDRAGFSIVVVSGRNGANTADRQGVEIGFLPTAIFSQSKDFTREETNTLPSVAALTAALTSYDLRVQGGTYTLSTGGTTLLTGSLKDYTGASGFGTDVYRTPNFLFLGDDTTSAQGAFSLRSVSLTAGAAAPEPSSLALLASVATCAAVHRRRRTAAA